MEKQDDENHTLTFAEKTFTVKKGDEVIFKGTYKADAKKKPRQIDLLFEEGPGDVKDKTSKAIFEIKGDTLRICTGKPGEDDRPTEFSAPEGTNRLLLTFKRATK
jgi:uncharacterized protein (TIGR03067 family)